MHLVLKIITQFLLHILRYLYTIISLISPPFSLVVNEDLMRFLTFFQEENMPKKNVGFFKSSTKGKSGVHSNYFWLDFL